MKTATLPAVRVSPDVRSLAESVLREGETLSMFIEDSLKKHAQWRKDDAEFYARGLRASQLVKEGKMRTYTLDQVMTDLRKMTDDAKKAKSKRSAAARKTASASA